MKRYLAYLKYVLIHKWYVLLEGRKLQVPMYRLIIHDWDKFLPNMFVSYAQAFYNQDGIKKKEMSSLAFEYAWNGHEKINKHHWQYWLLVKDTGDLVPLPIPDKHRREMLADWNGVSRVFGVNDSKSWYDKQPEKMKEKIHPETRQWIESNIR